jgi:hypothetical protein
VGILPCLLRGRIPVGKYRRAAGGIRQVKITRRNSLRCINGAQNASTLIKRALGSGSI